MSDIPPSETSEIHPPPSGDELLGDASSGDAATGGTSSGDEASGVPNELAPPSASPGEVRGLSSMLVKALMGLALLLLFSGVLLLLFHFRAHLTPTTRGWLLLSFLVAIWGGYLALPRPVWRTSTVACLLLCLSWLDLLLLYGVWVAPLPLWLLGALFLAGCLVVPLVRPGWPAVALLALGTLAELFILWTGASMGGLAVHYLLIWGSLLTTLALWALGGFWCGVTSRSSFRPFAFLGPLCYTGQLLLYLSVVLYPGYLSLPGERGTLPLSEMLLTVGIWLLPALLLLLLRRKTARLRKVPPFSRPFLLFLLMSFLSLPAGLLLASDAPTLAALPVVALYALSILLYGASSESPFLTVSGCALFFLTLMSLPVEWGGGSLSGGMVFLLVGGSLLCIALRLRRRRALLLTRVAVARRRQQRDREEKSCAPGEHVQGDASETLVIGETVDVEENLSSRSDDERGR